MKHGCRPETSGKGSSALCMWGMVSMAFLHACSLSLCPLLFFSSCQIPVYPPVCFIPPCLWWRSMVLHVLVKGLVVLGGGFRAAKGQAMRMQKIVSRYVRCKTGQRVISVCCFWSDGCRSPHGTEPRTNCSYYHEENAALSSCGWPTPA